MAGGGRNMIPNRGSNTARGIYVTRANGGLYQPGYSHFYNNYSGWLNGYWNGWYIRPWLWGGGGLGAGWLLSSAYANYFNPYYSADLMPFYDYGVPLAVYDPTLLDPYAADDGMMGYYTIDPQRDADLTNPDVVAATQLSEQARAAFAQDYEKAQALIDKAVKLSPKDPILHEFRALVLFAQHKYLEATATIYDVLAVGPGCGIGPPCNRSMPTRRHTRSNCGLWRRLPRIIRTMLLHAFCWLTNTCASRIAWRR